jgi:hypothetical protein
MAFPKRNSVTLAHPQVGRAIDKAKIKMQWLLINYSLKIFRRTLLFEVGCGKNFGEKGKMISLFDGGKMPVRFKNNNKFDML